MDRSTLARTGIAGAVAGLGLAVGGVALASADTTDTPGTAQSGRPDGGHAAEVIADELGLDEDVVADALDAVHDDLRPDAENSTPPEPPTEAERAAREAAFAKALAKELGVGEAKVKAALDVLHDEMESDLEAMRAEMRTRLVERLDAAVKDGTLSKADKASVLKAYDAKVIGEGPGFGGPPGLARQFAPRGEAPPTT